MIKFEVPVRLVSVANLREHWSKRAKRAKQHRVAARYCAINAKVGRWVSMPCVITITRIAPRRLDTDNNITGAKNVRDGIADALCIDDADPRVEWKYTQAKGKPKEYSCMVEIEAANALRRDE